MSSRSSRQRKKIRDAVATTQLNARGWKPLDETLADGRWVMVAIYNPEAAAHAGMPNQPWTEYKARREPGPIREGHTGWWHETGGFWVVPTLYREIKEKRDVEDAARKAAEGDASQGNAAEGRGQGRAEGV